MKEHSLMFYLEWASEHGQLEVMKFILNNHLLDVHNVYNDSWCLLKASQNGHIEVVKLLLERFDFGEYGGHNALRSAEAKGHKEIVKLLSEYEHIGRLYE